MNDDRGKPITPRPTMTFKHAFRPRSMARGLAGASTLGDGLVFIGLIVPAGIAFVVGGVLRRYGVDAYTIGFVVVILTIAVFGILLGLLALLTDRFDDNEHRRRRLLTKGRCAACFYMLAGLPAQDDGRTVCPECNASWELDRPERRIRSRVYIRDARGTRHWACREFQPVQRQAIVPWRYFGRWCVLLAIGVAMLIAGVGWIIALRGQLGWGFTGQLPIIIAMVGFTIGVVSHTVLAGRESIKRAIDGTIANGRCPACWAGLPEDVSGMVECGCKAVWRLPSPNVKPNA